MEENLSAKISFTFLSIYEKNVTCKRDPEARDRDETETFDFQSETRPRPRRSHISPRPRRDRDVGKMRLETVSRPRRRDRDYIPGYFCIKMASENDSKPKSEGKYGYDVMLKDKILGKTMISKKFADVLYLWLSPSLVQSRVHRTRLWTGMR